MTPPEAMTPPSFFDKVSAAVLSDKVKSTIV
jgi:hypothetical protein